MLAEFYRPDAPDQVIGRARWTGSAVEIRADDEGIRRSLGRIFRPTPLAVDDPSVRPLGTTGPTLLQPGALRWFTEAALVRAGAEGLAARLAPGTDRLVGYDPAGLYRPFTEQWERMA